MAPIPIDSLLNKEDTINKKSQLLPTARLSDAVRLLKVGKVVGADFNRAEIIAARGKPGVCVTVDARLGRFEACLLTEWDEEEKCYFSSNDVYNDMISSSSWRVVSAWIKDKFS
jgi:hypothetical protein